VLLDPEVGAAQCVAAGVLHQGGLLVAVEATGYAGTAAERESRILPGWSVQKARRMGASAVKLLVYYHPDTQAAEGIEELVSQVADDCLKEDLPLFVEPLSYSADPLVKKLAPADRKRVVLETARRLTMNGVEILKAEFPVDVSIVKDEAVWADACRELTQVSRSPWVLLSAAVDFDTYLRQVRVACECGASGVAVGRAVWQEASDLSGDERTRFLQDIAAPRMRQLRELCDSLGSPWTEHYHPASIDSNWYKNYME
ncbi:MAG: tagatose 1,6-diphosphate aldolase, partial [Anaerolineaceae bacterium]|nr:tagatose 1,6-diphosphate aldolase [Anaerolineaceae bacterium]